MIDVVSSTVWSTPDLRNDADSSSAGIRVPGPKASWAPLVLPIPGGETWSHWPPNSSYVTTMRVFSAWGPSITAEIRSTRWSLPSVALA